LEVRHLEEPEPGPGEVLVRVEGCGVCGSNLEIWQGRPWFQYPLPPGAPGHEGWGHVVGTGARVAFLCERAFAEYAAVEESAIVTLPESLTAMPFPGEPLACAVNVVADAGITAGDRVAVVGAGFLGLCVTGLAAAAGAEVTVLNRSSGPLETALRLGATRVAGLGEAVEPGFDIVVEAAGRQETLDAATALPREEGTLVIAGFHQDGSRTIDLGGWNWRALRVVNAHHRDRDAYLAGMREAVRLCAAGEFDPRPLFTHCFGLDDAGAALDAMASRPPGFVKALVLAA
jgi:threonine dehydrogenase-like Zn-dependent dehydrogenase